MSVLKITGWRKGLKKIAMTNLLKDGLGISLAEAKGMTGDVLDGKVIFITVDDGPAAKNLASELSEIGAIVKIEN